MLVRMKIAMKNPHGINRQAAQDLKRIASKYNAEVSLLSGDHGADVSRPFQVTRLRVESGDEIIVSATGMDAFNALKAVTRFLQHLSYPALRMCAGTDSRTIKPEKIRPSKRAA